MAGDVLQVFRERIAAIGWSETARLTGLDRCNLHRAFGTTRRSKPTYETLCRVGDAIGLKLTAIPK